MKHITILSLAVILLSGCVAPKSFLEPKYRGITYSAVKIPAKPNPIELIVVGETNGKENPRASQVWRRYVERVLAASRVFEVNTSGRHGTLAITINDIGDRGAAAGKGFMSGLTFGAVGSLVTDGYVMKVDYTSDRGFQFKGTYQHAIYTTIGNASAPQGITPVTLAEAPGFVAEDMMLHFLKELQEQDGGADKALMQTPEPTASAFLPAANAPVAPAIVHASP
jgi:hypothetical protein